MSISPSWIVIIVHSFQRILAYDDLINVLLDAIKQELVLFFIDAGYGQFAKDFVDCFELA